MILDTEIGERPLPITLTQNGSAVTGKLGEFELKGTMQDGKLTLKADEFYTPEAGFKAELALEGTVTGNSIAGSWRFAEYSGSLKGEKSGTSAGGANPNGKWDLVLSTEVGDKAAQLSLKVDGETVTGSAGDQAVTGTFRDGSLVLKLADFFSPDAGFRADLGIQGKIDGDTLQGSWNFAEYSGTLRGNRSQN